MSTPDERVRVFCPVCGGEMVTAKWAANPKAWVCLEPHERERKEVGT